MVLLDSRSGSKELYEPLKARLNGQVKMTLLRSPDGDDIGDVAWEGVHEEGTILVGCEYKKLGEMLTSMRNNRYIDQLDRLQDAFQYIYLLVEGNWRPGEDGVIEVPRQGGWVPLGLTNRAQGKRGIRRGRYYYAELESFFCALEARRGVKVLQARSQWESVSKLVARYNWWQKPWDSHKSTDGVKAKTLGLFAHRHSLVRVIASELPGLGYERSKAVEGKFSTVEDMVKASVSDWLIPGVIGAKTAEAVWKALREVK